MSNRPPSRSDARPRPTRSYTNSDTNRNITQEEAPGFEHVRPRTKISHSEQQPFVPVTPAVKRSRSRDPTQDSNTRNKRQNVVAGSSCCLRLTPEKTIENRSYQLETLAHKNHKGKCDQREVKAQKYEEDRKEVFVLEYTKCDGAEQTSQASVDVEVNGITRKKQVYEFGQTHQEAESKLKQPESSSPRQQSCSNTLIPYEIKSHIEEQVIAAVSSHVEALKSKMNMMMEEKMKQMFDDLRKTDKAGVKPARGIRKLLGKRKE